MQLSLIILASVASFAQGSRYGLLRVGSSASGSSAETKQVASTNSRSLFDEDLSLAFRQLFGYQAGLSLSMGNGALPLSLSMLGAGLSLSMEQLAPLSLSMGTLGFMGEQPSGGLAIVGPGVPSGTRGGADQAVEDSSTNNDSSSDESSSSVGAGTVAAVSGVGAVAAVAIVAVLLARKRKDTSSSTASVNDDGSL